MHRQKLSEQKVIAYKGESFHNIWAWASACILLKVVHKIWNTGFIQQINYILTTYISNICYNISKTRNEKDFYNSISLMIMYTLVLKYIQIQNIYTHTLNMLYLIYIQTHLSCVFYFV